MTILKEFQRKTLFSYKKWFIENYYQNEPTLRYSDLLTYYINEFLKNN